MGVDIVVGLGEYSVGGQTLGVANDIGGGPLAIVFLRSRRGRVYEKGATMSGSVVAASKCPVRGGGIRRGRLAEDEELDEGSDEDYDGQLTE